MKRQEKLIIMPLLLFVFIFGGAFILKGLRSRIRNTEINRSISTAMQPLPVKSAYPVALPTNPMRSSDPLAIPVIKKTHNSSLKKVVSVSPQRGKLRISKRGYQIAARRYTNRRPASLRPSAHFDYASSNHVSGPEFDSNFEFSRELQEIDYQDRQESDFLTKKVGLTEEQIQTMEEKRKAYLSRLQELSEQEKMGLAGAAAQRRSLVQAHIQWMTNYLGPENYSEYLNMTSQISE